MRWTSLKYLFKDALIAIDIVPQLKKKFMVGTAFLQIQSSKKLYPSLNRFCCKPL